MSIVQHSGGSSLAIDADQTQFTPMQVSALEQIGVDKASEGDLAVFFHVCQRSGLDPFAKQIYMIGRQVSERDEGGNWVKVTKQTIQTGIDGFRLIGRRAADRARHGVSVKAPEWAHVDGSWRPVWISAWGTPVAARVTIERGGEPFAAVALFDEYKQTKYGGELTSMWAQRPAGQLAKCAEALAWRMAFPQDLSGIYSDDEMGQADTQWDGGNNPSRQVQAGSSGAARMGAILSPTISGPEAPEQGAATPPVEHDDNSGPESAIDVADAPLTKRTRGEMFALFSDLEIAEDQQIPGINHIVGKDYTSRANVTEGDALAVIKVLRAKKNAGSE